ncbi:hypothetical protein CYMTET_13590 [Cymbomonas tetramitiformis]|uniref:Uncharacterized protein n=1 Tax=Cymbomonas tetramitiformis TaxID=36881 RepID=A0AAE0LAX2_9CHLO|nr:hypothetical protein CYMTET_13590 [Cymbomonas tetramitiformis]
MTYRYIYIYGSENAELTDRCPKASDYYLIIDDLQHDEVAYVERGAAAFQRALGDGGTDSDWSASLATWGESGQHADDMCEQT